MLVGKGVVSDGRDTDKTIADVSEDDDDDDAREIVFIAVGGEVVEGADTVELWSAPSCFNPHVFGSTASSDLRLKGGVSAQSSSAKFSSCIWQMPLLL